MREGIFADLESSVHLAYCRVGDREITFSMRASPLHRSQRSESIVRQGSHSQSCSMLRLVSLDEYRNSPPWGVTGALEHHLEERGKSARCRRCSVCTLQIPCHDLQLQQG